jgi:type I restriction enzyme M protein
MLNGDIRSKIDALWNAFWTGGISNPLEVIEQITYLLFLKRLDDLHTLEENKAARLKLKKLERRVFPETKDPKGRPYEDCRWSRFKHFEAKEMFEVVDQHVFPFLRTLGGDDSTYAHHMKDARFTIAMDNGAKKVLIPIENKRNFFDVSADILENVDPIFFGDVKTAAMKALAIS